MKSRRTAVTAALAALAVSGGSLGYSAAASARDRAGTARAPGTAGMAATHERMSDPGMVRMHELMTAENPGMAQMHQRMLEQDPGMTRMHQRMSGGSR